MQKVCKYLQWTGWQMNSLIVINFSAAGDLDQVMPNKFLTRVFVCLQIKLSRHFPSLRSLRSLRSLTWASLSLRQEMMLSPLASFVSCSTLSSSSFIFRVLICSWTYKGGWRNEDLQFNPNQYYIPYFVLHQLVLPLHVVQGLLLLSNLLLPPGHLLILMFYSHKITRQ